MREGVTSLEFLAALLLMSAQYKIGLLWTLLTHLACLLGTTGPLLQSCSLTSRPQPVQVHSHHPVVSPFLQHVTVLRNGSPALHRVTHELAESLHCPVV